MKQIQNHRNFFKLHSAKSLMGDFESLFSDTKTFHDAQILIQEKNFQYSYIEVINAYVHQTFHTGKDYQVVQLAHMPNIPPMHNGKLIVVHQNDSKIGYLLDNIGR